MRDKILVVNRIENRVRDYLDGEYSLREENFVPRLYNVHLGKRAYKTKICAFYIDLRNSTDLLFKDGKAISGKVHKAFLNVVSEVIQYYRGEIRDFQGDGVLAFWPANYKSEISSAVRAGFALKWFFKEKLKEYFEPFGGIDYGIGIDWGEIYVLRVGITATDNSNDLVYIGKCVNFAVGIANHLISPNNMGISESVYSNLEEDKIYATKNDQKVNKWEDLEFIWKNKNKKIKTSSWRWSI